MLKMIAPEEAGDQTVGANPKLGVFDIPPVEKPVKKEATLSKECQTLRYPGQEELLKDLECPVCYKYMVSVIEECSNGHSLCEACRDKVKSCPQCNIKLAGHRNRLAETIAAKLTFPCQNADVGCTETARGAELADHQATCRWRIYDCFSPECKWNGRAFEILDHFRTEHNASVLMGEQNTIVWRKVDFDKAKKSCYLINTSENLFSYMQEVFECKPVAVDAALKKFVFAHCMQYIGPKDKASDFSYKLELMSNDKRHRASFVYPVVDDIKPAQLVLEEGGGIQLTTQFINPFVDADGKLVQKLEIIEKN